MAASDRPVFDVRLKLGSGGMGEVHLARMRLRGKDELVALKRIRADMIDSPEVLKGFEREAAICALIEHENVVSLRAFGVDEKGPFIAFEYVDGRSASVLGKELSARGQTLPLDAACAVARDAAAGLAHAHQLRDDALGIEGIVHRDISPDNVLVSYDGKTKLADFGIARILGGTTLTRTANLGGKYGYIAPELFDGHEADQRSDLFALAATIYKIVTGAPAFPGKTEAELVRAVLAAKPARMGTLREVPAGLEDWVARALEKDPRDRPGNLRELLAVLDAQLVRAPGGGRAAVAEVMRHAFPLGQDRHRSEVMEAVRVATVTARPRRKSGKPWRWLGAAVLAAALSGTLAYLSLRERTATSKPPPLVVHQVDASTPVAVVDAIADSGTAAEVDRDAGVSAAVTERGPQTGALWVHVSPWAHVFVDGRPRGTTPLKPLRLRAGTHTVLLVNDGLNVHATYPVVIEPDRTRELRVVFDGGT